LSGTAAGAMAAAATTARAASFGNPDEPTQGAVNTKGNPASLTDIGYVKRSNGHYIKNVGDTNLRVQKLLLRGCFPVRLADPYAAGAGCPTLERRRSDDREISQQQPGSHARVIIR
jgi:hypothetical protein